MNPCADLELCGSVRPIRARIDGAAFRHNYLLAKARASQSKAWCVIKADAYGHGLMRCAEAVRDVADGFALLDMADAIALREAGFTQPILLIEGVRNATGMRLAAQYRLSLVVHQEEQLQLLAQADVGAALDIHLKFNTGMNRLGFPIEQLSDCVAHVRNCPAAASVSLMTHFADADGGGISLQWARFAEHALGQGLPVSACNSSALLRFAHAHGDWVRPGIMLYGSSPMPALQSADAIGLQPVMTLSSGIIAVQELLPRDSVGYGCSFTADKAMRVGIVACGYADGYPRHAGTGTPILVDGQRTRTLGRVSMDMLACDLTDLPQAGVGSDVTLWGQGLPADEVATAAGTISYELFCALARRVPVIA